jgi:chromosome segregation ATPase
MEIEQLAKRVEWLDDERRKDKNVISKLEEQVLVLEGKLATAEHQSAELLGEVTQLRTVVTRMDQFDQSMVQQRAEVNRQIKDQEKLFGQRDDEITSVLRAEIRNFESALVDLRKELATMRDFKKDMQARVMEEIRLARLIEEVGKNLDDLRINEEEQSRTYRLIEDGRRQDVKRLTDLQGEVTALRKRTDEQRGRIDVSDTSLRKLETRLNELLISERERSDSQAAFQEKQALQAVERDSIWKDWQTRFETIEKQSMDIENQLQSLDAAHLNIKRTQETVDDLIQRVERRINEVAEIQRLVEERFRQEWTTFKADDQKRWTNYTLSQDEQRSEFGRRFERINERVTYMEDGLQEIQDLLQYVNELNASNLQSLLSALSEFVAGYERTKGATR